MLPVILAIDSSRLVVAPTTNLVHTTDIGSLLAGIAAICSAIIWPAVIVMILWMFRAQAIDLLKAAVGIAEGANRFRIWQIEFDRDVQQQVAQSVSSAAGTPIVPHTATVAQTEAAANIPGSQVAAASGVRSLLDAAPNSTLRKSAEAAIKSRMLGFAQEYEVTRASMSPGDDRTRAMNAIVAKMRSLGLAAGLFLDELMAAAGSPGQRLAAICILQLKPEMRAVPWLVERMRVEQPFVFFHASVALLNAVRRFGAAEKPALSRAIASARASVQSYGENADANTVRTLTLAQSELETSS